MEMDLGVVGAAIRHIGGESEYGLKELKRLESEGRGTEFLGERHRSTPGLSCSGSCRIS